MAKKKVKKLFRGGPPGIGDPSRTPIGPINPGIGGHPGIGGSPGMGNIGRPQTGGARGSVETIRDTSTEALDQLAAASSALGDEAPFTKTLDSYKKGGKVKKSKKSSRPRGYGITKRGIKKTKYL